LNYFDDETLAIDEDYGWVMKKIYSFGILVFSTYNSKLLF